MRCTCCNKRLPPTTTYRTILIPHTALPDKLVNIKVLEDFCESCSSLGCNDPDHEDLSILGLDLPEATNFEY